VLINS